MTKKYKQQSKINKLEEEVAEPKNQLETSRTELTQTNQELAQAKATNQNLQNSLTNQQTANQTLQNHYKTRKNQVLFSGAIGLIIILYLVLPYREKPVEKEELKTWIYV